ncbi:hypothetical protein [Methylorubrum populi]|uniref:hypothetical protein n=1 Tax=Methylorubrum populi TaxID=223967 RepID=UPI003F65E197
MFDDTAGYFYENIIETYNNYIRERKRPSGRFRHTRSAIELASALFHFREHLPKVHAQSRSDVEAACVDYRLIADAVNAAKHRVLNRVTPKGQPLIDSADRITECLVVISYIDDLGKYTDSSTSVTIECTDGTRRDFDEALINVLNYWISYLELKDIVSIPPFPARARPGAEFVSREAAKPPNMEVMRGVRWKQAMMLMAFNPETGCAEPIDLAGGEVQLNIYEPLKTIEIDATDEDSGQTVQISLDLTDEESSRVSKADTETERNLVMDSILDGRKNEIYEKIREAQLADEASKGTSNRLK